MDKSVNSTTDSRIKWYGCYLRSLQSIVEQYTGKTLTAEQIVTVKDKLLLEGLLDEEDLYANAGALERAISYSAQLLGISNLNMKEASRGKLPDDGIYDFMIKRYETKYKWDIYNEAGTERLHKKDEVIKMHFVHVYKDKFINGDKTKNQILFDPDPNATAKFTVKGDPYTLRTSKEEDNFYYAQSYRYIKIIKN